MIAQKLLEHPKRKNEPLYRHSQASHKGSNMNRQKCEYRLNSEAYKYHIVHYKTENSINITLHCPTLHCTALKTQTNKK